MARRDHDRAVHLRRLEHRRHEHRRRRGEPAVHRHAARRRQRLEDRLLENTRRDARIMADRDAKIPLAQSRALREELHEPARDAVCRLRREIHRLIRHPFDGDTAHVAAVRELQQSFFCHHNNAPCQFSFPPVCIPWKAVVFLFFRQRNIKASSRCRAGPVGFPVLPAGLPSHVYRKIFPRGISLLPDRRTGTLPVCVFKAHGTTSP